MEAAGDSQIELERVEHGLQIYKIIIREKIWQQDRETSLSDADSTQLNIWDWFITAINPTKWCMINFMIAQGWCVLKAEAWTLSHINQSESDRIIDR